VCTDPLSSYAHTDQAKLFDKIFQNHAGHSVFLFFILISALHFLIVHRVKEKCREFMSVEKESLPLASSRILMWMHSLWRVPSINACLWATDFLLLLFR